MVAPNAAADESDTYSHLGDVPLPDGEFITRTEFELAIKQLMTRFIKILVRAHKNDIGDLEVLLRDILKH